MGDKIGYVIGFLFWGGFIALAVFGSGSSSASSSDANSTPTTPTSSSYIYDDYESEPDYESEYADYDAYDGSYDNSEPDFSNYDYNPEYNAATDLDCEDIGYEHYVGYDDPNGLDGDGDGQACEGW